MRILREHPWYAEANGQRLTSLALALIAVIAVLDALLIPDLGLGFLYFIPIFVAAAFMSHWWQILVISGICSAFAEGFSSFEAGPDRIARVALGFLSYVFVAVMSRRLAVFSRAAARRLSQLEEEASLHHKAEEQLEMLINSSPAAIVAMSPEGNITLSNKAAHELFGVEPGGLTGLPIKSFLPTLEGLGSAESNSIIRCSGRRANGDDFPAFIALSRFKSAVNSTVAVIIVDAGKTEPAEKVVGG